MTDERNSASIQVDGGSIRGRIRGSIAIFLGVPYAAPPKRFELPQPPQAWDGVRDMNDPGPAAPHRIRPFPMVDPTPLVGHGSDGSDGDYLRLNVWAPTDAKTAPVMVFIHGGGFVGGCKDAPVHDGTAFAESGAVCVAINYRMGIDGFLPVPGVPTNLGLRDMLFALAWVQRNIAAFGGDPAKVTVFGESAGAMAIADLVTSPLAKGLFQRAIIQSGHGAMVREIGVAQRLVRKLAKVLRIVPDASGFLPVSDKDAMDAIDKVAKPWAVDLRDGDGREPVYGISRFIPVYGDDVLPEKPIDALRKGAGSDVEIVIGSNADEMNLYFVPTGVRKKIGGLFARWLLGRSHPEAKAVLKAYGYKQPGVRPGEALTDAMNDLVFRWPARQYAAAHQGQTWMYEFDWRSPACDGELGACHGIEMPFVFKTLPSVTGPQGLAGMDPPQALADRVHDLWAGFARTGAMPWPEFGGYRMVYQVTRGEALHEPVMPAAAFVPE
ncbi:MULTISPECIES: carboxylesterase/lipase family protein [unclassified Sphingopyxis]|jgi:para-nitrobenzyl esterase|uniref:carboxylesterase/lipase family protein n=1 Tax=unclassified Sphingopyxis TaxID=2614943 RepID=UPI0006C43A15|nr:MULTISPECIES: carboxylesterase family protein [unclassified Sphingopyxis]USI76115.1 carboxylesterase family protein [Sphingopyxis sp. USTB-05]GAO77211.1 putative carboxylesterase [Sphingopyxis sp. C-1]